MSALHPFWSFHPRFGTCNLPHAVYEMPQLFSAMRSRSRQLPSSHLTKTRKSRTSKPRTTDELACASKVQILHHFSG